jgi:hypothetical protein
LPSIAPRRKDARAFRLRGFAAISRSALARHARPTHAWLAPAGTSFGRARASLPLHIGADAPEAPPTARPAAPPSTRFDAFRRHDGGAPGGGAAHSSQVHDAPRHAPPAQHAPAPAVPRSSGSGGGGGSAYATPPRDGRPLDPRAAAPGGAAGFAPGAPALPRTDSPRALFGALRAHFRADAARAAPWLLATNDSSDPLRGDALFGLPGASGLSFSDEEPMPPPASRPRRTTTPLARPRHAAPARSDVSWPPRRDASPPPPPAQQLPDDVAWELDDLDDGADLQHGDDMQRELDACFPIGAHVSGVAGAAAGAGSTRRRSAAFADGAAAPLSRLASPLHSGAAAAAAAAARADADEAAAADEEDADGLACFSVSPQRKRQNAAPQPAAQPPPRAPLHPWRF